MERQINLRTGQPRASRRRRDLIGLQDQQADEQVP
jgi:hypothetical protein